MWWRDLQNQFENDEPENASSMPPDWRRTRLWFLAALKLNFGEQAALAEALDSSEPVLGEYQSLLIAAIRNVPIIDGRKLSYRLEVKRCARSSQKKSGRPRKNQIITSSALADWIECGALAEYQNRHMIASAIRNEGHLPFRLDIIRNIKGRFPDDTHYRDVLISTQMSHLIEKNQSSSVDEPVRAASREIAQSASLNLGEEAITKIYYKRLDQHHRYYEVGKAMAGWATDMRGVHRGSKK